MSRGVGDIEGGDSPNARIRELIRVGETSLAARAAADLIAGAFGMPVAGAAFHNVFAHPFWLYHPVEAAERLTVHVEREDGVISVRDDAGVPPLRLEILESVAELVWAPLLAELARRGELPRGWRATVRAALFCCPLLVTDLVAPGRAESVRYLGLARAVVAGSEPRGGSDELSRFLDSVTPP